MAGASSPSGFALRVNGSCAANEQNCGQTAAPYHGCCPHGSFCPSQYNIACCPSSTENCTDTLLSSASGPSCANETWDLYDNNGYFCCLGGTTGYATTKNTDGCASPGFQFRNNETLLDILSSGTPASETASSTATSIPALSTPSSAGPARETNVSAIAGGTVGAVLGLAALGALGWWWWWHFRRGRDRAVNFPGEEKEGEARRARGRARYVVQGVELDTGLELWRPRGELEAVHGTSQLEDAGRSRN